MLLETNDSDIDSWQSFLHGKKPSTKPTENKGWTPEARAAAIESRREHAKGPQLSDKAQRAKQFAKYTGRDIQRYSEEHNETRFAKRIGGLSLRDNEPVDVVVHDKGGQIQHGIELKTMTDNGNNKITMKKSAIDKKMAWARKNHADFHTVVFDDTKVKDANGPGQHDESRRVIYYRRGAGSFRVGGMHQAKNLNELRTLMSTPTKELPAAAKPSGYYPRIKPR